jgi:hypothetical protein
MSELWGGLPPDNHLTRAPDPLLWLVRELRDALEQAGRSLDNADIPWPWDKSLFVRADAALAEAPKAEEGSRE